jgi:hypothetical protein
MQLGDLEMGRLGVTAENGIEIAVNDVINFSVDAGRLFLKGLATVGQFAFGPVGTTIQGVADIVTAVRIRGKICTFTSIYR